MLELLILDQIEIITGLSKQEQTTSLYSQVTYDYFMLLSNYCYNLNMRLKLSFQKVMIPLLLTMSKDQNHARLCGKLPDQCIISNELQAGVFKAHIDFNLHFHQEKDKACLRSSFYTHTQKKYC